MINIPDERHSCVETKTDLCRPRLHWCRLNASLHLLDQLQDIFGATEGEGEARASLAVRVNNPAERAVVLAPELALHPDVLATHGAQTLHDRRVRVELSVLEARYEAVAPSAHPPHFGTVERQVESALV